MPHSSRKKEMLRMENDDRMDLEDPYGAVELEVTVDGKTVPLNSFSKSSISRVVVALISAYRGAERYRERPPKRLEVKLS